MHDLFDLLETPDMSSRRGPLFAFLAEAQDYNSVLAPLKKLAPDFDWKPYEAEITEARRILGRSDRIIWFLRIWRLFRMNELRLDYERNGGGNPAFTQDVVNNFIADYRKRFDGSFDISKSPSPQAMLERLGPVIAAKLPAIEAVQFGSQNPASLIPELSAVYEDAKREREEREADKKDPLRRIDHTKPPTQTARYQRDQGEVGPAIGCRFCGIKASDPSTWGRCKEREISLINFDDKGNVLPESASLYAVRWVLLKDAQACQREAESMIHCGNAPQIKPGDQILSLRQPVTEDGVRKEVAHLTFVLHGDGMLGEMKAPNNNKPGRRWHRHILTLLMLPMVKGIRGGGYMAQSNFSTSDLSPALLAELMKRKPHAVENDTLLKMVREKKLELTPELAARFAKLDRYELQDLLNGSLPWTRETLGALISGQPPYDLLPQIVRMIPGLAGDERLSGGLDFREMVRTVPEIMALVGERNLLPYVDMIGAAPFSKDALKEMPPNKAAKLVKSREDLKSIPRSIRLTSEFVNTLVGGDTASIHYRRWNPEAIKWLSRQELSLLDPDIAVQNIHDKAGWDRLPEAITSNTENRIALSTRVPLSIGWFAHDMNPEDLLRVVEAEPRCFKFIPDDQKTDELAELAATSMSGDDIERFIPDEHRTPTAWQKFYNYKVARGGVRLKDVPARYRSRTILANALGRHPEDVKEFASLIDADVAKDMFQFLVHSASGAEHLKALPKNVLRDPDVFEAAHRIWGKVDDRSSYSHGLTYMGLFPISMVAAKDPKLALAVVKRGLVPWSAIPDELRTPEIIAELPDEARKKVPVPYITPEVVAAVLKNSVYKADSIPLKAYTPEALRLSLDGATNYSAPDIAGVFYNYMAKPIPKDVLMVLASHRAVPLSDMPNEAMTPEGVMARLNSPATYWRARGERDDSIRHIPSKLMDEGMAVALVSAKPELARELPEKLLTSAVFDMWSGASRITNAHGGHEYGISEERRAEARKALERFPVSSYTPEGVKVLVKKRIMEPDEAIKLPPALHTPEVIAAIVAIDPEKSQVLSAKMDDKAVAQAVAQNWSVMKQIDPSRWNEKLAFVAMQKWASSARSSYSFQRADDEDSLTFQLRRIPRDMWDGRVWREAVGYIAKLSECPDRFKTDEVILAAVERNPFEIASVEDPAAFLNRMAASIKRGDSKHDKDFAMLLERKGVVKGKKGWVNARDLPGRAKLPNGGSATLMKSGPSNVRVYIFDHEDKLAFNLYTDKGEIKLPPSQSTYKPGYSGGVALSTAKKNRTAILEAARAMLGSYKAGQLNWIGIYGHGHGTFYEEKDLSRGRTQNNPESPLRWVKESHVDGTIHIAWLGEGDDAEPILRMTHGSNGGRGWSSSDGIKDLDVLDMKACVEHGKAIFDHLRRYHGVKGFQLAKLGIMDPKGKDAFSLLERKLAESGEFSIWKGGTTYPRYGDPVQGDKIALCGPSGLMAHGIIKKDNTVGKVAVVADAINDEAKAKITDMFTKLGNKALSKPALTSR